ncbi:MAG TPA: hypothetical protein VIG32_04615 [Candidatus Baltobacteraceae bacterium]|jgi:hypothetical protein
MLTTADLQKHVDAFFVENIEEQSKLNEGQQLRQLILLQTEATLNLTRTIEKALERLP